MAPDCATRAVLWTMTCVEASPNIVQAQNCLLHIACYLSHTHRAPVGGSAKPKQHERGAAVQACLHADSTA